MQVVLHYSSSLAVPNSYKKAVFPATLRARVRLGYAKECTFEPVFRYRTLKTGAFIGPLDGDLSVWRTETSTFGGFLTVPVVLVLQNCPSTLAEYLILL